MTLLSLLLLSHQYHHYLFLILFFENLSEDEDVSRFLTFPLLCFVLAFSTTFFFLMSDFRMFSPCVPTMFSP